MERLDKWLEKHPKIKTYYQGHESFWKYFVTSFLSLAFEIGLVYALYTSFGLSLITSNLIGMTADFLFTYWMSRVVFNSTYDVLGFLTYLATSILGLFLNTLILKLVHDYFYLVLGKNLAFLVGKFFATGIPFFLKYFLRKHYFVWKERNRTKEEDDD